MYTLPRSRKRIPLKPYSPVYVNKFKSLIIRRERKDKTTTFCIDVKHNEEVAVSSVEKIPEQLQTSRNRDFKIEKSHSVVLPCKTLLELTVGWAAGVLARDTTFAMTGVESFLKEGGPDEEAGAIERFAG